MANLIDNASKASSSVYNLRVITALRYAENVVNGLTSMTYFFDPNWQGTIGYQEGTTLPIAFFDLLTESITQSNEVSTNRVMVYEGAGDSSAQSLASELKPASLNAISDNVVVNPLEKELEALVPYGALTFLFTRISALLDAVPTIMMNSLSVGGLLRDTAEAMLTISSVLKSAVSSFSGMQNLVGKIGGFSGARLNIDSLIAMSRNRTVVMYKTFDSWDFKYAVIKNVKISKKGTEQNYVRCSITLVEIPVLAVGNFQTKKAYPNVRSIIGKAVQQAIVKFVNTSQAIFNSIGD